MEDEVAVLVGAGRGRGRPRDPDTDTRILTVALALLGRDGFARMSLDAVAAAAGVTKPTIYRRYAGKAELAAAALASLARARDASLPTPTGDLRHDLEAQLGHFLAGIDRPYGLALVGTVLSEESETPELLAMYRRAIVQPRRALLRAILQAARDRGELRPDADLDTAVDALIGSYYAAYLERGPIEPDWPARVTGLVVSGLLPS